MSAGQASLLVDVSNGRTKFALLLADSSFSPVRILPTAELTPASVKGVLSGWEFRQATIASVVPSARPCLEEALSCPVHWLGTESRLNLAVEYETPSTLGADRLACAAALARTGVLPALAVDAGTAVTFDLVLPGSEAPVYKGGAIAPGLRTMMLSLSSGTALLPAVSLPHSVPAVGRNTQDCLRSGLLHGFAGMVHGVLEALAAGLPGVPHIVFTGGDADFLVQRSRFSCVWDKMLVFKGLAVADMLNH